MEKILDMLSLEDAAQAFAALGSDQRLAVLQALVAAGPNGLATGALAARLAMPASTLSHHIKILREAGLVSQTRQGRTLLLTAAFETVERVSAYLMLNCCAEASASDHNLDRSSS
ncbi:MAG: metalloregulator ArsR/SmtB family transcription factor [Pseudomonadota bacterium]